MQRRKSDGALSAEEKRVVKALINRGRRLQDIQALINFGRAATVNSARLTEVKQDKHITPADSDHIAFFELKKRSYDPLTGLNLFEDERLIRAREAMILAVQLFNSPSYRFKSEVFAVLANIAWTYLLHEHYDRQKIKITAADGRTLLLSQMLKRQDCPLTKGVRNNLESLKEIRDAVEHLLLARSDLKWLSLFQACCLNFDKALCDLFSPRLTLQNELGITLQFARLNFDQIATVEKFEIPAQIEALDARLRGELTEAELGDLEYQFRVVYTLDSASKTRAHIHFVHPGDPAAEHIRNVLIKFKPSDELYPYKPRNVATLVSKQAGKRFTSNDHAKAWRLFKVRPAASSKHPEKTVSEFCMYHAAHKDYTYSQKWVDFLVSKISTKEGFDEIRAVHY